MRKLPPIRTWTDVIDEAAVVGHAICQEVKFRRVWLSDQVGYQKQRSLYALSCFVIAERATGWAPRARDAAAARLAQELAARNGRLDYVGPAEGPDPE